MFMSHDHPILLLGLIGTSMKLILIVNRSNVLPLFQVILHIFFSLYQKII